MVGTPRDKLVFDLIAARGREGFFVKMRENFNTIFSLKSFLQLHKQVGFSGIEVSPMDDDVSWFSPGESYAWDQEYKMAALARLPCHLNFF